MKYVIIVITLVNQLEYVLNAYIKRCAPPHIYQMLQKVCWSFTQWYMFHLGNGVCDNSKSCETCGQWLIGPVLDYVCNISYCSYCSKSVKPDHQCFFIEVKKRPVSSRALSTYLTLKGQSPIFLMFLIIIIIPFPTLRYYTPDEMKPTLCTQPIEWHKAHENNVFDLPKRFMSTAKQTFSCTSKVALSLEKLLSQIPV